jgi:hypothetical protein
MSDSCHQFSRASSRVRSAPFSPIMIAVALVFSDA